MRGRWDTGHDALLVEDRDLVHVQRLIPSLGIPLDKSQVSRVVGVFSASQEAAITAELQPRRTVWLVRSWYDAKRRWCTPD